jgi:hypothetical protein
MGSNRAIIDRTFPKIGRLSLRILQEGRPNVGAVAAVLPYYSVAVACTLRRYISCIDPIIYVEVLKTIFLG